MAKTKIFWIAKKVDDTMQMWGYNNKRNAEEKGLELYGVGMTDFSFKLDGEEFEDEDGDTAFIYSGQIDSFGHFLLYRADGMPGAIGLEQERAATEYVESELPNSAGACFPAKLKGGSCDVYMSSAVEANGALWTFEDGEVNEKTISVTEANGQTVKEFSDLLALLLDEDNGLDIERAINAMAPNKARVLEKQISTLYKRLFDLTNQGFDLREDNSLRHIPTFESFINR